MKLTRLNELMDDDERIKGRWELGPNHEVQYRESGRKKKEKKCQAPRKGTHTKQD